MSTTITRRSALTAAAVAVVGGIAGYVYGRNSDAAKSTSTSTSGYGNPYGNGGSSGSLITEIAKVPVDGGLIKSGVVVTRGSNGALNAFSSTCTHLHCTVGSVKHGRIFCPCHGSVFNAITGAVEQGPASSPLPRVQITVKNGGIYSA